MKKLTTLFLFIISVSGVLAQQNMRIHNSGNTMYAAPISAVDSIKFDSSYAKFRVTSEANLLNIQKSLVDSITFTNSSVSLDKIYIIYNGTDDATIINPFASQGVSISASGGTVIINASSGITNLEYNILGATTEGSLTMSSDTDVNLVLNNLTLHNPSGAAFNITSAITSNVYLTPGTTNTLSDTSSSSKNATFLTSGAIIFDGNGTLNITGNKKHAISSSSTITVQNGYITISSAVSDGFHSEGFTLSGGALNITATADGIDAGDSDIIINAGAITISSDSDEVKGIKTGDGTITINSGTINASVNGDQSKGLSADGGITINGGTITLTLSGNTVLESSGSGYAPSYPTGIKTDGILTINSGTISIQSTGLGGKGFSADGNIIINDGTITITTAGNGATYTNESGVTDSYTATCIKSDTNINLFAGSLTLSSSGTGGKGIKADGAIVIGNLNADDSLLNLNISTSGERFYVSGSGENADYANPKAVSSDGNLTVNSGTITINCTQTQEGGEGLESKSTLTINGGKTEISTYDDSINASNAIIINGGDTYCYAKGNDGIDSNGTLTINGGFTISNGARNPEEGFDCDSNTFTITGGTIVGTGGNTSNPTTTVSTQRSIKVTTTAGTHIAIRNSSNQMILMYKVPAYSSGNTGGPGGSQNSVTLLFTSPLITNGSYTLLKGGTVSGGTDYHYYNTGGTYSGGTSTTFTVSSMLTSTN